LKNEVIIALIASLVEEQTNLCFSSSEFKQGLRGIRGPRGFDGTDFDFEEYKGRINSLVTDHIESIKNSLKLKYCDLNEFELKALRGEDGDGFDFDESKEKITKIIADHIEIISESLKLKFSDLSGDEIGLLRGPKGRDGDGFDFDESKEKITKIISDHIEIISESLKLKFSDLSGDEIGLLRGPKGRDGRDGLEGPHGKDGKDFVFAETQGEISTLVSNYINEIKSDFKLKISDLNEEELLAIRGPRGQRGKQGRDFSIEENADTINALIIAHITTVKEDLKLKFSELSEEERESLKLKFQDLTEEDRYSLKGPRGQRGRQGRDGKDITPEDVQTVVEKNKDLLKGERGPLGPRGIPGISGSNGFSVQGPKGDSAPIITGIRVEETVYDELSLEFDFSDGHTLITNKVQMPTKKLISHSTIYTGSGGGGSTTPTSTYEVKNVASYTIQNSDITLENTYPGATFYLPAAPTLGQEFRILSGTSLGSLTLDGNGKNINGDASLILINYDSAPVQYNGTQWRIL